MLYLKKGVTLNGVKPEIVHAMQVVKDVYAEQGKDLTVTSITESTHGVNSLHYVGYAFDCRTFNLPENLVEASVQKIKDALGDEFDVIHEIDHLHLEFQPKKGINL